MNGYILNVARVIPAEDKPAILKAFLAGQTPSEIAQQRNWSTAAIHTVLREAILQLADIAVQRAEATEPICDRCHQPVRGATCPCIAALYGDENGWGTKPDALAAILAKETRRND